MSFHTIIIQQCNVMGLAGWGVMEACPVKQQTLKRRQNDVFSAFFHRIFSAEIPSENVRIWSHNFRSFSVKRTLNFRQIYTELPSNLRWISVYLTFFHRSFIIVFDQNSTTKKVEKTAETGKKRNYMLTITSVIFESAETKIGSANNITSNERIPENWIWCSIRMSISIGRVFSVRNIWKKQISDEDKN